MSPGLLAAWLSRIRLRGFGRVCVLELAVRDKRGWVLLR
jgi:hypothetical protein